MVLQTSARFGHLAVFPGRWTVAGIITLTTLLAADRAYGCSCMPPGPACHDVWQSSDVFAGRVVALSAPPDLLRSLAITFGEAFGVTPPAWLTQLRVRVSVTEVFRGTLRAGEVDVFTGFGDPDCGVAFVPGERYLIYGDSVSGTLFTSLCSRTSALREAVDDLAYLRGPFRQPSALGSIQGQGVRREITTNGETKVLPVSGAIVVATSTATRHETRTAMDGTYQMRVPPGRYRLA